MSRFNPEAEKWRQHPFISQSNNIRRMFPGFGIALGAFAVYCVVDYVHSAVTSKKAHAAPAHAAPAASAGHGAAAPSGGHGGHGGGGGGGHH
eukprot:c10536_g1_i1.p2 GENE.c10536_g1_i1~~c10536_g1_i1.p2  ORF type:complete len:102 (+),score=12.87 c10536_g1_i1:32-307(+)